VRSPASARAVFKAPAFGPSPVLRTRFRAPPRLHEVPFRCFQWARAFTRTVIPQHADFDPFPQKDCANRIHLGHDLRVLRFRANRKSSAPLV
jgi:hypothetical protein